MKKTVSEEKTFLYCYQVSYITVSTKLPGIELNLKEILFLLTLLLVFLGLCLNSGQYLWLCTLLCDVVGQIFHSHPAQGPLCRQIVFFCAWGTMLVFKWGWALQKLHTCVCFCKLRRIGTFLWKSLPFFFTYTYLNETPGAPGQPGRGVNKITGFSSVRI